MPAIENDLDFWAEDIQVEVLTPLMILRAQVPALRKKTKGILQAEVATHVTGGGVGHDLFLVAPALDNYREKILTVNHKEMKVYPCHVSSEGLDGFEHPGFTMYTASSQKQLVDALRFALRSDFVRGTIDSLLAKSNEMHSANGQGTNPTENAKS